MFGFAFRSKYVENPLRNFVIFYYSIKFHRAFSAQLTVNIFVCVAVVYSIKFLSDSFTVYLVF